MRIGFPVLLAGLLAHPIAVFAGAVLHCTFDGREFALAAVENGQVMVEDATGRRVAPREAVWRLTAEPEELATLACWAPSYDIAHAGEAEERLTPATPWRAGLGVRLTPDPKTQSAATQLTLEWEGAEPNAGAVVAIWMVGGQPSQVQVAPLPARPPGAVPGISLTLRLTAAEIVGRPVLLYWKDGSFRPAKPIFADAATQRAAVAIVHDDAEGLAAALAAGARIDAVNRVSQNLAQLAAATGAVNALKALHAKNRKLLTTKQANGSSPLLAAAANHRLEAIQWMLGPEVGAGKDAEASGVALLAAARAGHAAIIEELTTRTRGAHFRDVGVNSVTAAIRKGHLAAATVLWQHDVRLDWGQNSTLLVEVIRSGHEQTARFLLEKNANPKARLMEVTPVHACATYGSEELLAELLAAGGQASATTSTGYTTLMAAAESGRNGAAKLLLERGAKATGSTREGVTALHIAARSNAGEMVELLLAHGALRDAKTERGFTPLDIALLSGAGEAARRLVSAGAAIDLAAPRSAEMLECSIIHDIPEPIQRALASGWPAEAKLTADWPAIRVAEIYRAERCAAVLREAGAPIASDGSAPLARSNELDAPLRLITGTKPDDPRAAVEEYPATEVRVEFLVNTDGRVLFPRIVESPDVRLAPAVFDAIRQWRFQPPLRQGNPVAVRALAPIQFPASIDRVFDVTSLDQPPRVVSRVPPVYPLAAKRAGANGKVLVEFIVSTTGVVEDARVTESSHEIFEGPALTCLRAWKFEPGLVNGLPVRTKMVQPLVFIVSN